MIISNHLRAQYHSSTSSIGLVFIEDTYNLQFAILLWQLGRWFSSCNKLYPLLYLYVNSVYCIILEKS